MYSTYLGRWVLGELKLPNTVKCFPLVTDISPILRLSLLSVLESVSIIASFGSLAVAGVIFYVHHRQHNLRVKVTSADISMKLFEKWRVGKNKEFQVLLDDLYALDIAPDDPRLGLFLNTLEEIAVFWNEDTLTDNHVKEFFGSTLELFTNNPVAYEYFKNEREENPKSNYKNLQDLLDKPKIWR